METYYGVVRSPADAIKLFEACRLGLLPRVQRRLSEKERQAIRSGSVFVWDEREAGMRRWTDGKSWSASRVAGSFLTYREMEGKRGNAFGGGRRAAGKTPDSGRGSDEDHDDGEPDGYRYKPDGLTKQSFSITNAAGQHLHLIAYYSRGPLDLPLPTTDPSLRHIVPAKGMYPESSLAETTSPATGRAPLPQPAYMPHHHQPPPPPPPHHGYPSPYPYPAHAWPPSPDGTPPYSHGQYPYPQGPPPQGHPPPGLHPYPPPPPSHHPHHHYPPAESNPSHERSPLPPPPHMPSYPPQHAQPHPSTQPYPHPQPHPQQQQQQQPPPPPHSVPQLPAPRMGAPAPQTYPQSQHQSPQPAHRPPLLDSPRSQHLQAKAREAVQIEPRLAPIDAARNQHSPLPAPGQLTHPQQQQNGASPITTSTPTTLPPPTVTASPPINAPSASPISDGGSRPESSGRTHTSTTMTPTTASTRPTLSALLHPSTVPPAPAPHGGSEPSSAHPVSAGGIGGGGSGGINSAGSSSPGGGLPTSATPRQDSRSNDEDARAIGVLNKNFF
ncbi:hypothetical protein VTI28DRAFT_10404 [Corynascus sepedonium]